MRSFPSRPVHGSWRVLALAASMALVAAACGGGGGKKAVSAPTGTQAPSEGTPKPGGKVIMATEAEIDGFDPTKNRWDVTGTQYASTVYDPLVVVGKDCQPHPYLAEALDHNADYTQWTIKLRSGITYHNGDPLTADDVVFDLTAAKNAPLTGKAYDPIDTISKVDNLSVLVKMKEPWVPFPFYLSTQVGFIANPKTIKDGTAQRHPVGTGPFVFQEWVPNNHFIATKNPNYWQKGLPYLDSVEYRPIVETTSRESSLVSGTIDMLHTTDTQMIADLRKNSSVKTVDDSKFPGEQEEGFTMLNAGKPPFDNPIARQAVAAATDTTRYSQVINNGLLPLSDGPFGNVGSSYHAATGYQSFDLNKAKQLVQQYQQQAGKSLAFELASTPSSRALQGAQLVQDMWQQAGMKVTIKQIEQSQYILQALLGNYQAIGWRQFGEPDPDMDFVWWSSTTALAQGQLALNFSRNKDPQVDADLATGRHNPDPAARKAAYEDLAKRFSADNQFIWFDETVWQIAFKPNIHGVVGWKLPDGAAGADLELSITPGAFMMNHVWVG